MKRRMLAIVAALALCSLFATPQVSARTTIAAPPDTTARVRVIHASPDAPNVDVLIDDVKKLGNVPFFTISDYLAVAPGNHNIKVQVANTATIVINVTTNFAADTSYTVAAIGEVATGSANPLQGTIITDTYNPPLTGFGQVRAFHFAPGVPPVQIRVKGGPALVPNLAFPNVTVPPLVVASGTYTLEVALAAGGTAAPAILTLPGVKIEPDKYYDFYAVGKGTTVRVEVRVTENTAKVRVIHAAPDAPNVDVYSGDTKVLANVPFFTISDYLTVPAASTRFRVVPTGGALSSAVIDTTLTLKIGRFYTISAVGLLTTPISAVVSEDDMSAPAPGTSRVRVYHFSPNTPAVGVRIKGGATLIPSISFKQISPDAELLSGVYNLEVFVAPGGPTALAVDGLQLDAGRIYDIFATDLFPNTKLQSRIYGPNATAPYRVLVPYAAN